MQIPRIHYLERIHAQFKVHGACALLGPRQCGKTTLARQFAKAYEGPTHWFDLEHPDDVRALSEPMRALEHLQGLVIIDEIQRIPELFPILRVLIDRQHAQYLILGSASRELIRQSSESLAGRIGYIEMTPLQLWEYPHMNEMLVRGGFPGALLTETDADSYLWRESYIQNFLERDIPMLGLRIPPQSLRRFWLMLTHLHGQLLTMSPLATAMGVSGHTIRHYLDILSGTFMVRILQPWHENLHKRQVKTPKLYFRDTGILLGLLGIKTMEQLLRHPALGAIWEGFALEQMIQHVHAQTGEVFFWRTQHGAELDLLVLHEGKRLGFEFKYADAPSTTKSMHSALSDLRLDHLYVIYPGTRTMVLGERITVVGLLEFSLY